MIKYVTSLLNDRFNFKINVSVLKQLASRTGKHPQAEQQRQPSSCTNVIEAGLRANINANQLSVFSPQATKKQAEKRPNELCLSLPFSCLHYIDRYSTHLSSVCRHSSTAHNALMRSELLEGATRRFVSLLPQSCRSANDCSRLSTHLPTFAP